MFGIYSTAKLKKYEVCVCVSMSTEKKLSPCTLRIIRLHSEVGDGGQRVGQRPPTEQSADGPQLFATGCNKSTWPQTLKASQRLKLCFLIKHLQDCTKH